jgi:hypothetical protein
MIPDTKNGLNAMTCISALQKAIRRGMEREASSSGASERDTIARRSAKAIL